MEPERLIEIVNEKYGKELLTAGDDTRLLVDRISTTIPILDMAMGGGFPRGRITELIGAYSSGKSLLALFGIVACQKSKELACFIDVEKAFDPVWAGLLGVDLSQLVISRPNTGEEAFDLMEKLVRPQAGVSLVVLDSIAHLIPTAEAEEEMGQQFMGLQARLVNKGLRKVVSSNDNTAVILINQTRESIGKSFGNPETLPGGKGHAFASSIILRVLRGSWIMDKEKRVGHLLKFRTEKNKVAPPWQECEVPFYYEGFIDREDGLLSLGLELGLVKRSGAWYTYKDTRAQGRDKLLAELREQPKLLEGLRKEIEYGDD